MLIALSHLSCVPKNIWDIRKSKIQCINSNQNFKTNVEAIKS